MQERYQDFRNYSKMFFVFLAFLTLQKVPILSGPELKQYLQNSHRSVVFFLAGILHVEENGYDVLRFKNKIDIVESTKEEGLEYNCSAFPCIIPFADGVPLKGSTLPNQPASFSEWLQYIISIDTIQINTTEQINILLNGNGSFLFAVDYYTRPVSAPIERTVYLVPSKLLKGQVSKGLYSYDTSMHVFSPIVKEKHDVVEPEKIKFGSTKFIAGYMIQKYAKDDAIKYSILTKLSHQFPEDITFTVLSGPASKLFKRNGRLELIPTPYFFIFDVEKLSKKRWIVRGQEMMNVSYLTSFIMRVKHGKEPETVISEPDPKESNVVLYRHLVASKFKEAVFENKKDVVVLFQTPWSIRSVDYQLLLRRVATLLKNTQVRVYWFDASENEIPEFVPDIYGFPSVIMWPANKKNKIPVIYNGKAKIDNLLKFISEHASKKFDIPETTDIETRLTGDL